MRIESPRYTERFGSVRINELQQQNILNNGEEPPKPRVSAPPKTIDLQKFNKVMKKHMQSYSALAEE